jgi:archaellum component FlaC
VVRTVVHITDKGWWSEDGDFIGHGVQVIDERDLKTELPEVQRGDQQGPTDRGHPSGAQADRDTSVLSETEARERADGGSDRGERGEDGRTVTVDVQIWDEMNYKYLGALRLRDDYAGRLARSQAEEEKRREELFQARAEIQKQRERANRSQNEAQQRVSELRSLNHRYEAMQARAERLEDELARVRAEFDDNNAILEDTIARQAERIKAMTGSDRALRIEELQDEVDSFKEKLPLLDKVMNAAHPLVEALEELMLDE